MRALSERKRERGFVVIKSARGERDRSFKERPILDWPIRSLTDWLDWKYSGRGLESIKDCPQLRYPCVHIEDRKY